ncbi:MAG: citS 1 [Firmicutes bacterium]|nr:citS 1 [Bacillota bacterium]
MPEIDFAVVVFNSFPEAMALTWLSLSLLGIRPLFRQVLSIGCLQSIFVMILYFVIGKIISIPFGVHTFIQVAIFALIMHGVMRIPYKSACLATLIGVSIYCCLEAWVMPLYIFITGYSLNTFQNNWWLRMPYIILQMMVVVLIIFLVRRFNLWLPDGVEAGRSKTLLWLASLLLTQTLLINFFCWKYYLAYADPFQAPIHLYFVLINAILPLITMIIIRQLMGFIRREVEDKAQLDTLSHVEKLLYTMRTQRHDFSHELQVVYGLLQVEEYQEALNYLKKSVTEVAATSELVKTDNLGVTALLYTKTGLAEARKIALHITVETSLKQAPLEGRDINVILGNLIDNAMDAVEKLPIPERQVSVTIGLGIDGYILEVQNYGAPIPPAIIGKIFMPGVSTKGQGHGMGLYSIQKLVSKYNGKIKVKSDNNGTSFHVVIPE